MTEFANKKRATATVALTLLCCAAMAVAEIFLVPSYILKSAIKLTLFLLCPLVFSFICRDSLKPLFIPSKKGLLISVGIGLAVFSLILGGYFLLRGVFDFSSITDALVSDAGVDRDSFVFISIYISLVNSMLEEFFFRGFAFLRLKNSATRLFAYIFSAASFSVYHVAMMIGWFSPILFALVMLGLFVGGLIFNYFNEKFGNIYASWMIHLFANLAINTIGMILFGII